MNKQEIYDNAFNAEFEKIAGARHSQIVNWISDTTGRLNKAKKLSKKTMLSEVIKGVGKGSAIGGAVGAGAGITGATMATKTGKAALKSTATGAGAGALLGGVIGGAKAASRKSNNPSKLKALKSELMGDKFRKLKYDIKNTASLGTNKKFDYMKDNLDSQAEVIARQAAAIRRIQSS
jgi:hypothetical protein